MDTIESVLSGFTNCPVRKGFENESMTIYTATGDCYLDTVAVEKKDSIDVFINRLKKFSDGIEQEALVRAFGLVSDKRVKIR